MRNHLALVLGSSLLLCACVDDGLDDESFESDEEAITGGSLADEWMRQRAVKPEKNCTATLIAPRYAITALHCTGPNATEEGSKVSFYTDGPGPDPSPTRTITHVYTPPGTVRPPTNDQYDSNGFYADIAVLRLDAVAPSTSVPATLAWAYPGDGAAVQRAGAGQHNGQDGLGVLRKSQEVLLDDDYVPGMIRVVQGFTEPGDSGGPLYRYRSILSITHSGRTTSVPQHLDWILFRIGFVWPNGPVQASTVRHGTVFQNIHDTTEDVCKYACEHSPADAYNYAPDYDLCQLITDVTGVSSSPYWRSAEK